MFKSHAATTITGLFALGLVGPAFAATSGETQEQTASQGTSLALTQAIHTRARVSITAGRALSSRIVDAQNGQIVGGPGSGAD